MHVRRYALGLACLAVARRINADESDCAGPTLPCPRCGGEARYVRRQAKTFETVLGAARLERAYYHCAACRRGFCPRDRALGLEGTDLSPGVTRMTGAAAGRVSFAAASSLLAQLAGVRVEAKHVERTAEALGRAIAAVERAGAFPAEQPQAEVLYLGVDGTGVPMRKEDVAGRAGKQADGSSKTRECKVAVIWAAPTCDSDGLARCDGGSVSCSAAIESAAASDSDSELAPFAQRVRREALRRGFDQAQRQVVIGDGARWIWRVAGELFPRAVQILDYYHASEHLWDVARALGGGREQVEEWAEARCADLKSGRFNGLLATLQAHAGHCEEARKCAAYFERNRERMRYKEFRQAGLQIGSGVVEAACKRLVGGRLKQSGMHWTRPGADAILELRSCILSGRYEQFWELRSDGLHAIAA